MLKQLSTITLAGSLFLLSGMTPAYAMTAAPAPQLTTVPAIAQPAPRPTRPQTPTTREPATPIPSYDAAAMISTFANEQLAIDPTVSRAVGVSGEVTLPPTTSDALQSAIAATVALAGQVSVGTIRLDDLPGSAQVAVGAGTISGDLDADITAASLGSYQLFLPTAAPADSATAAALLVALYPALGDLSLIPVATEQGYLFKAVTTAQHFDPATKTLVTTTQIFIAGVNGQSKATAVWTIVANGEFATALSPVVAQLPS